MADLVRDHVGLRELAGLAADVAAAEAGRDLLEERGVEIDLLVRRAIERPHGALRDSAAAGLRLAAVEHENRRAIGLAVLGEDLLPHAPRCCRAPCSRSGPCRPAARRCVAHVERRLHLRLARAGQDFGAADEEARIDAERPADQAEHHDRADAQTAAADRDAKAAAPAAEPPSPRRSSTLSLSGRSSKRMAFLLLAGGWISTDRRARRVTLPARPDQRALPNIVARRHLSQ